MQSRWSKVAIFTTRWAAGWQNGYGGRAIDALLQGLCFHYDPLANRVQCSITTLAIECGLATESAAGTLSITRATRALTFLSELGLISYQTEYDPLIGCNIPTDISL